MKTQQNQQAPNWNELQEPFNETVAIVKATNDLVLLSLQVVKNDKDSGLEKIEELNIAISTASKELKAIIEKLKAIKPKTEKNKVVDENDYQEYYNVSIELSTLVSEVQNINDMYLNPIVGK